MGDLHDSFGLGTAPDERVPHLYAWDNMEYERLRLLRRLDEAQSLYARLVGEGRCYYVKDLLGRYTTVSDDARYGMRFSEVRVGTPGYGFVEHLMQESFPECERPDFATLRHRLENDPLFFCCVITTSPEDVPVGLLTYWRLGGLIYVEHFAISPQYRGHGYGNTTLAELLLQTLVMDSGAGPLPIVLEVETPDSDEARRRIAFYQRNGLALWPDTGYLQPSYRPGGPTVPMRIMATPNLSPYRYPEVRHLLYRHVYQAEP